MAFYSLETAKHQPLRGRLFAFQTLQIASFASAPNYETIRKVYNTCLDFGTKNEIVSHMRRFGMHLSYFDIEQYILNNLTSKEVMRAIRLAQYNFLRSCLTNIITQANQAFGLRY